VRELADQERVQRFMRALGAEAPADGICYFAGGATAVLLGWREATLDIDIKLAPDQDQLLRALPAIKDELQVNVELASPAEFIPLPTGWEERSLFAGSEGRLAFRHFDLYSQALAKLERGHELDLADVREMLERGLVEPDSIRARFEEIETVLHRFPAVDPADFRRSVESALDAFSSR
jgi:hypothetical protein